MRRVLLGQISVRLHAVTKSTLLMNASYLMVSTFILGASGFLFWALITKTYDAAAVGLAGTLLSVSGLLSLLGLVGFETTFVRFLPKSKRKNDYINTGLIITAITSVALAAVVGLILSQGLPSLAIVSNPWVFASFVFFTVVTSLNTLTNAVFLAFKQARYVLIINALSSALKIALPLLAVNGDAVTIFVIAGVVQLFGLLLSIGWMRRKFNYKFSPVIHKDTLRIVRKFSSSIYVSNTLSLIPPTLLPLIILHHSGAKNAAYYYIAFTIAGALYTVVYASMQSVLAEGSHNAGALRSHVVTASKFITVLLVPATLLVILFGGNLLAIFGSEYASGARALLQLLAVGALPIAAYTAITTSFKVTKRLAPIIAMNGISTLIILGLSYWWLPYFGLPAVGWAWLIGDVIACGVGVMFLIKNKGGK
jgi:O-antigen/teichoic acid export membrane protein